MLNDLMNVYGLWAVFTVVGQTTIVCGLSCIFVWTVLFCVRSYLYGLFSGSAGLPQTNTPVWRSPQSLYYYIHTGNIYYIGIPIDISCFVNSSWLYSGILIAGIRAFVCGTDFRWPVFTIQYSTFVVFTHHSSQTYSTLWSVVSTHWQLPTRSLASNARRSLRWIIR